MKPTPDFFPSSNTELNSKKNPPEPSELFLQSQETVVSGENNSVFWDFLFLWSKPKNKKTFLPAWGLPKPGQEDSLVLEFFFCHTYS